MELHGIEWQKELIVGTFQPSGSPHSMELSLGGRMHVIDVNTTFGKQVDADPFYSPETLSQWVDRHQVAFALSCSMQGACYDARAGNDETLAVAGAYPQIIPVATLDPRDFCRWEQEFQRCLQSGFRAIRFFPEIQKWSVASTMFKHVMMRLKGSGLCLIFSAAPGLNDMWSIADQIAHATAPSGLPVIITDFFYSDMAELIAVMKEHPHVYAETHALTSVAAVEIMVNQVGADRLIYGSCAPVHSMQKAMNQVLEADISDDAKIAILGGNTMRLLHIPPDRLIGRPGLADLQPKRFSEEIIDVHTHLGYWFCPCGNEDYDPARMLRRMKQYHITHSILSSYESMRYDIAAGNLALAQALEGHPELHGYVELNPHQLELSCNEMDKYYSLPNFAGAEIELHHIPGPIGHEKVSVLLAEVARRGKPVLFMPEWRTDGKAERELAREHPTLTIIHAHGFDSDWAQAVADTPNICVEFNKGRPFHRHIRNAIDILGPDRVLFGSDQTLLSVGASVGAYMDANMAATERHKVLHENARRIFNFPA